MRRACDDVGDDVITSAECDTIRCFRRQRRRRRRRRLLREYCTRVAQMKTRNEKRKQRRCSKLRVVSFERRASSAGRQALASDAHASPCVALFGRGAWRDYSEHTHMHTGAYAPQSAAADARGFWAPLAPRLASLASLARSRVTESDDAEPIEHKHRTWPRLRRRLCRS